jgi:DNA-binding transcriptional regulator GbsR (MarR family)
MEDSDKIYSARMRLVETGGRTSQDLGLGRIVGQILVFLYLHPLACSLEELEEELGLSKASVSIAARQLEQLGLVQRVWLKGERKKYYRSAENIGHALQQGLLTLIRQKVDDFGDQLDLTMNMLESPGGEENQRVYFLRKRVERARKLQKKLDSLLGNPLLHLLTKTSQKSK